MTVVAVTATAGAVGYWNGVVAGVVSALLIEKGVIVLRATSSLLPPLLLLAASLRLLQSESDETANGKNCGINERLAKVTNVAVGTGRPYEPLVAATAIVAVGVFRTTSAAAAIHHASPSLVATGNRIISFFAAAVAGVAPFVHYSATSIMSINITNVIVTNVTITGAAIFVIMAATIVTTATATAAATATTTAGSIITDVTTTVVIVAIAATVCSATIPLVHATIFIIS